MKKFVSFVIGLGLAGALSAPTLAVSLPEAAPAAFPPSYTGVLTVNGDALDTDSLPAAPAYDMLPLRLVAENDWGVVIWDQEENSGRFYLDSHMISVDFATGAISVDDLSAGQTAQVVQGVTFVPAAVVDGLEGYSVDLHPELDVQRIDIATPNGTPMLQLGYQLAESAGLVGGGMRTSLAELEEYQVLTPGGFTEAVGFLPMMTSPDTLILGRVAPGKLEQVRADLENYRKNHEEIFTWYLSEHLPKIQNAQVALNGDWVLFVIGEQAQETAAQFQSAQLP